MTEPFDLFGFLEQRTFPSEDVPIYTNEQLALEAAELLTERAKRVEEAGKAKRGTVANTADIDARLTAIQEEAKDSAVIYHLRGVPQHVIDAAYAAKDEKGGLRTLAAMITSVTGPDGATTEIVFGVEEIEKMYGLLPKQGFKALMDASLRLVVASLAFDGMADAGFLAKS